MRHIGVTGARKLTKEETEQLEYELWELDREGTHWHIGDAEGVDKLARETVQNGRKHYHNAEGRQPWQLAVRSTGLVKDLAAKNGTLHAWANKPAPDGLKPCKTWKSASGSGTWGTVALAVGLSCRAGRNCGTALARQRTRQTQLAAVGSRARSAPRKNPNQPERGCAPTDHFPRYIPD